MRYFLTQKFNSNKFLQIFDSAYKIGGNFQTGNFPGSRLDHAYLIKELYSTCIMAHQCEAPKATTELLTQLTWFTLPGFEPATLESAA